MGSLLLKIAMIARAAACTAEARADRQPFALSPPERDEPIEILFNFAVQDVQEINDLAETFGITGVMTLTWNDPREAFDPGIEGVKEKLFQGHYQFNEVATGWYPQMVLINEAGAYQKSGVQLRITPDGTSILKEKITAVAETSLNMRTFPFDSHRLEAIFTVLGHGSDEVVLRIDPAAHEPAHEIKVPEWRVNGVTQEVRRKPVGSEAHSGAVSAGY
jgi:hypothetical protein